MFDTPLVQIAIGLVMVFVLFSLLVSSVQEMGVALCKSRGAALWDGIETLLGGGADARTARNRLYAHPLIRSLVAPSSWSKEKPGVSRRTGPSYIASGVFAQALLDLLREPHQSLAQLETELTRGLADLRNQDAAAAPRLASSIAAILPQLPQGTPLAVDLRQRLEVLQQALSTPDTVEHHAIAVNAVAAALPEQWKAALSESADKVSGDLGGTIRVLAANTAGSIEDLRTAIEHWFDRSMAGVSGWYKRWTMAVQLGVGLVLAVVLNIDTLNIIRELAANESLRRSVAAQADALARTSGLEARVVAAAPNATGVSVRSTGPDAFTIVLPGDAAGQDVAVQPGHDAVTCDPRAAADPTGGGQALVTCRVAAGRFTQRTKVSLGLSYRTAGAERPVDTTVDVFAVPSAAVEYERIEQALNATGVPIGWKDGELYPAQRGGPSALLLAAVGWLLTAMAGSLGAPFWFDLLKKVARLRASGPNPSERRAEPTPTA